MLLAIIVILTVSFILYTLLGGADFGAGIIETFVGAKGEKEVSKAMAPVWEANHVWLILAIVIIFTGFPSVYAVLSLYLHIPLMIVLFGIILRGSAFVFRYYDVSVNRLHNSFSILFKASSFITPVFLGVTLGAMLLGEISTADSGSFYERFIHPWFNLFCFALGLFVTALFAYIAAIFLTGETKGKEQIIYIRLSKIFMGITFFIGGLVLFTGEYKNHHLFNGFFRSPVSLTALAVVILLIPVIFYLFTHPRIFILRGVIAIQVSMIILGWFAIHFPVLVYEKNNEHLTFYNASAPEATLYQLFIALLVGLVLVLPGFFYLFKVFKN
ncbi:MAG TPA: cytochrome d ubiquinol oxidase subunit II [Saprospiraceae bacterium]|nr:cytochrome d ubiquinol oxidase subunit II [Saprospiraceae bacterium]